MIYHAVAEAWNTRALDLDNDEVREAIMWRVCDFPRGHDNHHHHCEVRTDAIIQALKNLAAQ